MKNSIITATNTFQISELVVEVAKNQTIELLGTPHGKKVTLLKLRQKFILSNCKKIESLKSLDSVDIHEQVNKLTEINSKLKLEIEKIRYAAQFERQKPILDDFEYQNYFKLNESPKTKIISEDIALETLAEIQSQYPDLFTMIAKKHIMYQNTDVAMAICKEIATDHQYSIRRMPVKA